MPNETTTSQVRYDPSIFIQPALADARGIILTPEAGLTTDERWERETAWIAERVQFGLPDTGILIDYACGIGRLARMALDIKPGLSVLGVDISPPMIAHSYGYVDDMTRFTAVTPLFFNAMVTGANFRASGAIAAWALQHIHDQELTIVLSLLHRALVGQDGSSLWTLNRPERYIPATKDGTFGWVSDGVSVDDRLREAGFLLLREDPVPETLCPRGAMLRRWMPRRDVGKQRQP